jgi:hypothetical protein
MTYLSWTEDLAGALRRLPEPDTEITLSLTHTLRASGCSFEGRVTIPRLAIDAEAAGTTARDGDGLRYVATFEVDGEPWCIDARKRRFLQDPYAAFTTLRGELRHGAILVGDVLLRVDVRGGKLRELLRSVRVHA